MANWPATPYVDVVVLQRWEVDVKQLAGKIHDAGHSDPDRAKDLLHALAALASEQLARVSWHEQMADDRARDERECSIPPVGA